MAGRGEEQRAEARGLGRSLRGPRAWRRGGVAGGARELAGLQPVGLRAGAVSGFEDDAPRLGEGGRGGRSWNDRVVYGVN